jgi:PqqD family protein of HPr-rel-A system
MGPQGDASECLWGWAGGEIHMARWGDEVVAYHELTASTHLLDPETSAVLTHLKALSGGQASAAALWLRAYGEPASTADALALNESLQALAHAGLLSASNL